MTQLKDKLVLITGASSGIGEAAVHAFAHAGAELVLVARREARLQALAEKMDAAFGTTCHLIPLDITDADKVNQALAELPAVDVLINNAGLASGVDKMQNANVADWDRMIDTNIKGLLYVTHAVLPKMVERDQGHIINLGSIAGHEVYPNGAVYCATKHAVKALSQGLKMDLLGSKIRVTSIDPGMVETEFSVTRFDGDIDKAKKLYENMTPLTGADIAEAMVFCASRPAHVNVSDMIILANDQAAATMVHRKA